MKMKIEPRLIDGIHYRRATVCDYEGVIGCVSGIYGGFDYLPFYYRVAAHTKGHYLFVAEDNGKVVSR